MKTETREEWLKRNPVMAAAIAAMEKTGAECRRTMNARIEARFNNPDWWKTSQDC